MQVKGVNLSQNLFEVATITHNTNEARTLLRLDVFWFRTCVGVDTTRSMMITSSYVILSNYYQCRCIGIHIVSVLHIQLSNNILFT